ncbi:MAG: hypothetical protein R3F30_08840 [Planctomycetota bacterium]
MRVLGTILLLLAVAALAWSLSDRDPAAVDGVPGETGQGDGGERPAEIPMGPADPRSDEAMALLEKLRPETWQASRNPLEADVPDPDGIGPCLPAHLGGRPTLVVQRYLERRTNVKFWLHDDGSFTSLTYQYRIWPGETEPRGRWLPATGIRTPTMELGPEGR